MVVIMIKIAIISNRKQCAMLKEYMEQYGFRNNIRIETDIFTKYSELYEKINSGTDLDLVLINADYGGEKAVKLASEISDEYNRRKTNVIFMSQHRKCSAELIKLRLFDYLTIPIGYVRLSNCMDRFLRVHPDVPEFFCYKKYGAEQMIATSKIRYLQGKKGSVVMHTESGNIPFSGELSQCREEECFRNYVRAENKYMINPACIEQVDESGLFISGNEKLAIRIDKIEG
jgi:DNA-binding LytR/AlgR family response regulator